MAALVWDSRTAYIKNDLNHITPFTALKIDSITFIMYT